MKLKRTARFSFQARSRPRRITAPCVSTRSTGSPKAPPSRKATTSACPPPLVAPSTSLYTGLKVMGVSGMLSSAIKPDFAALVGNTPIVRLKRASEMTGCEILGKCEFLNPGGSVKDRAAPAIITDAARGGLLRPGGVIVEGTAGNTGIGIALVANT